MRRITNKANLPAPLVRAVANDPYDASSVDFSTTTLIKPPRMVALERRHEDEIEEDASDRIWALLGQIGHLILERANADGEMTTEGLPAPRQIAEHRFTAEICGVKIGGQIDLLSETKTLADYKLCSHYSAREGVKPEWEQQLNVNAWLCRQNGIIVSAAEIVAIYRDWSLSEARRNKGYPQQQVQMFQVPLWSSERQEDFVCERIQLHLLARKELPECTPAERWAKPEQWAVMSNDSKSGRAIRLYNNFGEAHGHASDKPLRYFVEHRPGVQVRCQDYCSVSNFCSWWQDYQRNHDQPPTVEL